jgi:hypothetical protein
MRSVMAHRTTLGVVVLILAAGVVAAEAIAPPQATDARSRMASWTRHVALEQASPFRDLAWRAVGPSFAGGRIESIAVHPARPFTLYVGAGSGSVVTTTAASSGTATTWTGRGRRR